MKDLMNHMRKELLKLRDLRRVYEDRLSVLPEGLLRADEKCGRKYYYCSRDGCERYLGRKEMALVNALKERKLSEEILNAVLINEKCIEYAVKNIRPCAPEEIYRTLPKSYRREDGKSGCVITDWNEWENAVYVKKSSYGLYKDPSQITMKGDQVRSKSELNIANMMYMKRIPYRYEEVTELCGETIAPDFAVYRKSDGRILFLEHFGMMNNRKYRDDFAWKVQLYLRAGYTPYKDVFFTFDDMDGNIDTQFMDYLMETYFR